ncbi:histone deacetylase [Streptomyces sp. NPDC050703]|uniref:histone deacetylase n=1 Tax=Streptomyces sp. NPDC050703 TaxID=3157218 RepID=UPI00342091C7
MYFATTSAVWGGGRAFYDPGVPGRVLGRAHLVTVEQFGDIVAQEMYREPGGPGAEAGVREVLARGRAVLGDGRYETLVCAGEIDSVPVVTFTAPWGVRDVPGVSPAASYLRHLGAGLLATGAWEDEVVASYLAGCPGAAGCWSERGVLELLRSGESESGGPLSGLEEAGGRGDVAVTRLSGWPPASS